MVALVKSSQRDPYNYHINEEDTGKYMITCTTSYTINKVPDKATIKPTDGDKYW